MGKTGADEFSMTLIHVTVSDQMHQDLILLQQRGLFSSFSELGREAVRKLIRQQGIGPEQKIGIKQRGDRDGR